MFRRIFQKQRHAAAIQFEAVHEDVSAGFLFTLSDLKIHVDAYFNERIRAQRGDFFSDLKIDRVSVDYTSLEGIPAWKAAATRLAKRRPEFIFANTFQRDGIAKWLSQFGLPILGVVHNPDILKLSDHAMSLVAQGKVFAYGLAPHVVAKITRTIPELEGRCAVYHPVFWMRPEDDLFAPTPNCRRIFLAGAVDYKNRDFERLVAFLARDGLQTDIPVVFQVCTGGPDRKRLEQDIADFGLQRFFELAPLDPQTGRVPHAVYLRSLRSCDAVMPLLPQERKDYLFNKYSTGIAAGIGSMRPIIAPKIYGEVYGFPALEPALHDPVDISALDLSMPRLLSVRAEMKAIWTRAMAENQVAISQGLAALGLRAG